MDVGENDAKIALLFYHRGIEQERLETGEVNLVHFLSELIDLTAAVVRHRFVALARDGFDLGDDGAGLGLDDLGSVAAVDLVTVVVRRIVARGQDDARGRAEVADRKAQVRGRAGFGENVDIDTVFHRHFGDAVGELLPEVAGVAGDRERGPTRAGVGLEEVSHEAEGGAGDVVVIEIARADAGELGAFALCRTSPLGRSHDLADGASAETAGAEGELFEKTIVQFGPVAFTREPGHRGLGDGAFRAAEEFDDVVVTAPEQVSGGEGGVEGGGQFGIHGFAR